MAELNFPPGFRIGEHGEYQIIRRQPISEGVSNTFAEVYLAKKMKVRKKFAIKVLRPEIIARYKRSISDFQDEIRVLMELRHKNIITIDDYGTLKDRDGMPSYYLVMEYIENGKLIKENYSVRKTLIFFMQILDGLSYLHGKDILHRDIKPDNILVQHDTIIKITDFGVVKFLGEDSQISSVVGAPAYAPPEQILKSGKLSYSSDLYAAGKTLYSMISNQIPTAKEQIGALPEKFREKDWHDSVVKIMHNATETDQADRYQTAEEMKADITDVYKKFFYRKRITILKIPDTKKISFARTAAAILLITIIAFFGQRFAGTELINQPPGLLEVNEDIQSLFNAALSASLDGDLEFSTSYLQKAVTLNPDNAELKIALGKAYYDAGKIFEARRIWKQIQRTQPDNPTIEPLLKLTLLIKLK